MGRVVDCRIIHLGFVQYSSLLGHCRGGSISVMRDSHLLESYSNGNDRQADSKLRREVLEAVVKTAE